MVMGLRSDCSTPIALVRAWLLLRATSRHATARPPCTRHGRRRQRPRVCWTADSSKHDHVLRTYEPCRGSLRPRSPGCRLAGRSGHLIADGPRAAPNRPQGKRFRRGRRCCSACECARLGGVNVSADGLVPTRKPRLHVAGLPESREAAAVWGPRTRALFLVHTEHVVATRADNWTSDRAAIAGVCSETADGRSS
jgi:hypothetical protein